MITRITVQGFRGISGREVFIPEVLTVLTGRNGLGKTTFFDAIDWCLFGESSRFGSQPATVRNLYVSNEGPFVEVAMTLGTKAVTIARSEGSLTIDGARVTERELAETLIVDPDVFPPYLRDLGRQVRTVSYLAQEQIRDFVSASLTPERKALLRGLLGVPNAGLVESSVKRVKDHFAARERRLVEEADQLSTELSHLTVALNFDATVAGDVEEFVKTFRQRFHDSANSLGDVRASVESRLVEEERRATTLESALAAGAEATTVLSRVGSELDDLERRRQDLANRVTQVAASVQEGATRSAEAAGQHQQTVQQITGIEARVADLSAGLAAQQQKATLAVELASLAQARDLAAQSVGRAKSSADEASAAFREAERLAAEEQRQAALARERAALESQRTNLRQKAGVLEQDLAQRLADLGRLELAAGDAAENVEKALLQKEAAASQQQSLASSARRGAQIASLREQLLSLMDGAETRCPFCGEDYRTAEELGRHIAATASASDFDVDLQTATAALSESELEWSRVQALERRLLAAVADQRLAVERVKREISQIGIDDESIGISLAELGAAVSLPNAAKSASAVADLRASADSASRSLLALEDQLRVIEAQQARVAAELETLSSQAPATGITPEMIASERKRLSEGQRQVGESAEALQTLRLAHASFETALADLRSDLAGLAGRVRAEEDRRERVLLAFRQQCESAGIVVGKTHDVQALRTDLEVSLTGVRAAMTTLRDLIGRATSLEHRRAVNESVAKEQDQRRRLAETENALATLHQAQGRFLTIAEELEARSRSEADAAGSQHRIAIQDCINALYPHRHLNEVDVDFANGDLLVKDRWLTNGVRPEDYSSTGQSNVLALSVFLGLALRQTFSVGRFLLLDEPVQNLDDLHFLAFLTLVKRIALSRQVIISTADSNIAGLLRRQLRSWSVSNRKWCEYEWVAFDPLKGPTVRRHEGRQIAVA
jgi:DNA repair exonuclease SbcCD ATPase subunit